MPDYPITPAIRHLRAKGIAIDPYIFEYEEGGGTSHSSAMLGIDEHAVIKTLVVRGDERQLMLVLMHGDMEVSLQKLARHLGIKGATLAPEAVAAKATGYLFGGTSPFGTRTALPILAEASISALPELWINGGKRGFLVRMTPSQLASAIDFESVQVGIQSAKE